jgi:hypothetical protein
MTAPCCTHPGCGYTRPLSAPPAEGSGTVYPPDRVSSPHGASQGQHGASGWDGTTAGSPTERLRRAAELVEQLAADNHSDVWDVPHIRASLVPWVALMAPDLAPHLAALLRQIADSAAVHVAIWQSTPRPTGEHGGPRQLTPAEVGALIQHHYGHALALADEILRGEDR